MPRRVWLSQLFVAESGLKDVARKVVPKPVRDVLFEKLYKPNLEPTPPLDPAIRLSLRADFRDDVLLLQNLIGRDLSAWLAD
jgi:hypothetical protein